MVILNDEGHDYSHTPRPCRHLVTASLCFRGLFFWDALYTRNRDSEKSMINATIRERRFETRLQTRLIMVLKRDSTLGKCMCILLGSLLDIIIHFIHSAF